MVMGEQKTKRSHVFILTLICFFGSLFATAQNYAYYHQQKGVLMTYTGNYEMALKHCNEALEIDSMFAEAYLTRANSKFKMNNIEGAITDYTKAISLDPDETLSYFNRGIALVQMYDYFSAERDFTKAIISNPKFRDAYICRAIIRQRLSNFSGANEDFMQAMEIDGNLRKMANLSQVDISSFLL